jgi:hypothetical protein
MTTYINTLTLEYPRHIGDIQLENHSATESDLPEKWQLVTPVERPVYDYETQVAYELPPVKIDNVWYMQWDIRELTQQELEERIKKLTMVSNFTHLSNDVSGSAPNVIE